MSRTAKAAVLVLMLALLPLRVLAAATFDICLGHHISALQADSSHGHDSTHQRGHDNPVEHCGSVSFVASAQWLALPSAPSSDRISFVERFAAAFVPDHLDPPPLAL